MKSIPLIVIGSKQANKRLCRKCKRLVSLHYRSLWNGGGQTPMILEVIYEDDLQRSDDRAV